MEEESDWKDVQLDDNQIKLHTFLHRLGAFQDFTSKTTIQEVQNKKNRCWELRFIINFEKWDLLFNWRMLQTKS